jgi:NAD(P)-dependent dehydrogenase (short-subunit alcohol dehydrogenase family)/thioesterase domain-containing protein/acyl carrier protein
MEAEAREAPPLDPEGTVLVTGGTSGLGALLARHLAAKHGARHLLLVSRRGLQAEGAEELVAELAELGCEAVVAACDVSDRDALVSLLDAIPAERPLTAVIHAAGLLANGMIEKLGREDLECVLRPKLDAAAHLHELTSGLELSQFVLFSSQAAIFGNPGQANYAAANAFLDALACRRRAEGLAATSLAWGLWAQASGMAGDWDDASFELLKGQVHSFIGMLPLEPAQGLELFDAALEVDKPLLLPVRFDTAALRAQAADGVLSPLLRGLVRTPARRAGAGSLAERLTAVPEDERGAVVLDFVRGHVAAVLGHASPDAVEPDQGFKELGFDSLGAVELRNRLEQATGVRLPATLAFDHPTPAAAAQHLSSHVDRDGPAQPPIDREADGIEGFSPVDGEPAATLAPLFRNARDLGRAEEFMELLMSTSRFRPTFSSSSELADPPESVRLSEGTGPPLVCLPSVVAISGPHEYVQFASAFRGAREALGLPWPGFTAWDPLPASFRAAVDLQAHAIRKYAPDAPVVLVGFSTGGLFAHAVASDLEGAGIPPAAVVLIDTPSSRSLGAEVGMTVIDAMLASQMARVTLTDVRLTAMGGYIRLLSEWEPTTIASPTLLVRATEAMPGASPGDTWRSSWDGAHVAVDVPGDHLSIMDAHAASTAQAVQDWLLATLGR